MNLKSHISNFIQDPRRLNCQLIVFDFLLLPAFCVPCPELVEGCVLLFPIKNPPFQGRIFPLYHPGCPATQAVRPDPSGAVTGAPGFPSAVWHRGNGSGVIFPVPSVSGLSPPPDRWEPGSRQVLSPSSPKNHNLKGKNMLKTKGCQGARDMSRASPKPKVQCPKKWSWRSTVLDPESVL